MPRTWTIARREFLATARTKGFVIGTLFGPAILAGWILLPALFAGGGGTREIVVPGLPYIIVYRIDIGDADELVILGIFHGAQDRAE